MTDVKEALEIVLVNPEIPQNTGSIARTCAATKTILNLVGKLGFDISEKAVRRAGLDYWPYVSLQTHQGWEEYLAARAPERVWCFTTHARKSIYSAEFAPRDALVFGSETKGLGADFLSKIPEEFKIRIPMESANVRSLNLSNAVSIALYEARRQLGLGLDAQTEP